MTEEKEAEVKQEQSAISFSDFLECTPPSTLTKIDDLANVSHYPSGTKYHLLTPDIQLHCSNDLCNGTRFFRYSDEDDWWLSESSYRFFHITYTCSNCQKATKTFSLAAKADNGTSSGLCYKFGELPPYGPPTPSRLIKLIGPDRDIFLKGRRCENQGLGIGAFVYYRRVVENQKNRILDEIIKVSQKIGANSDVIEMLEAAKAETQFSQALSSIRDTIPQTLLINGHNPLRLLHSALSDGLHDRTDDDCLGIASSVRVVLAELSERLAQALKDEAEINNALSRLMKTKDKG